MGSATCVTSSEVLEESAVPGGSEGGWGMCFRTSNESMILAQNRYLPRRPESFFNRVGLLLVQLLVVPSWCGLVPGPCGAFPRLS